MKRINLIILTVMAFALLGSAQSRTQPSPPSKPFDLTTAQMQEYMKLAQSKSGKATVEAWVRKHKLQIVSLKNYDIMVIPEQKFENPTPQELSICDHKKCPTANLGYEVRNTLGQAVGYQFQTCTAGSCRWAKDAQGRNMRICEKWKCSDRKYVSYQ